MTYLISGLGLIVEDLNLQNWIARVIICIIGVCLMIDFCIIIYETILYVAIETKKYIREQRQAVMKQYYID